MRKSILFVCTYVFSLYASGQFRFITNEKYNRLTAKGFDLYKQGSFKVSGLAYDSAFASIKEKGLVTDLYNAACAWAMAKNANKAFYYLNESTTIGKWSNLERIQQDEDLLSLHTDKRWEPLIAHVRKNEEEKERKLNKPLVAILDTIYKEDQGPREAIAGIQSKYGWKSPQMDSIWKIIAINDPIDLTKVKAIIDKYGWPGPDVVGSEGNTTIFLVIQHADSLTRLTYLPLMREAVKKGKAGSRSLALLEDRVLTDQGKEQVYGSQVRIDSTGKNSFFPIMDERNVNKRRASVGLGTLEEYAKHFGIEYHLPDTGKKP